MSELSTKIDDFFHISERGSDIHTEIRGGIITFHAMLYILAVNPSILSSTTGIDFQDLVGATALAACVSLGNGAHRQEIGDTYGDEGDRGRVPCLFHTDLYRHPQHLISVDKPDAFYRPQAGKMCIR